MAKSFLQTSERLTWEKDEILAESGKMEPPKLNKEPELKVLLVISYYSIDLVTFLDLTKMFTF